MCNKHLMNMPIWCFFSERTCWMTCWGLMSKTNHGDGNYIQCYFLCFLQDKSFSIHEISNSQNVLTSVNVYKLSYIKFCQFIERLGDLFDCRAFTTGTPPAPRYHHSAVVHEGSMFVFGRLIHILWY